jgi:hypothetical protein
MASSFLPIVHTEKKKQLESAHYHGNRQLHWISMLQLQKISSDERNHISFMQTLFQENNCPNKCNYASK